jgi:hypothetical protein
MRQVLVIRSRFRGGREAVGAIGWLIGTSVAHGLPRVGPPIGPQRPLAYRNPHEHAGLEAPLPEFEPGAEDGGIRL